MLESINSLFSEAVERTSLDDVASNLGLNVGTLRRWEEQARVPNLYYRDLCRMLGRKEYVIGDERDKDQFYTRGGAAKACMSRFKRVAKELGIDTSQYTFIEPSAGAGVFYDLLPVKRRIGIDIEPAHRAIKQADYLTWKPRAGKYIVIGNPPFGLRGHLALQFINHSAYFADMVAFILPPLFNSDGKGVPAKRVKGYQLAHTSPIPSSSFVYPDGTPVDVESIFQVWTKVNTEKIDSPPRQTCAEFIRVYSLSDGGTSASTRNKAMLYNCDVYLPSTCFNGMRVYSGFEALPHRRGYGVVIHKNKRVIKGLLKEINWANIAFRSTNGALNLRTSLIENVLIGRGYVDSR